MKKVLVRNTGRHRLLEAVLERYGIGMADDHGRGRWITPADLVRIQNCMEEDITVSRGVYNGTQYLFVQGTSPHNHVHLADFKELFE